MEHSLPVRPPVAWEVNLSPIVDPKQARHSSQYQCEDLEDQNDADSRTPHESTRGDVWNDSWDENTTIDEV